MFSLFTTRVIASGNFFIFFSVPVAADVTVVGSQRQLKLIAIFIAF